MLYNRDPLTGICNRIAYTDIIRPAFAKYQEKGIACAFVFVDADDFKSVNDTYGHEFGDQVLIRIAQVLEEECPEQGYVCRYGGDEFIGFSHMRLPKGTTVHGSCAEPADQGKHYDQYRCRADVCGGRRDYR